MSRLSSLTARLSATRPVQALSSTRLGSTLRPRLAALGATRRGKAILVGVILLPFLASAGHSLLVLGGVTVLCGLAMLLARNTQVGIFRWMFQTKNAESSLAQKVDSGLLAATRAGNRFDLRLVRWGGFLALYGLLGIVLSSVL